MLDRDGRDPWYAATNFSFETLRRATPGLPGPVRARIFYRLPKSMQAAAWANLATRVELDHRAELERRRTAASFADVTLIADEVSDQLRGLEDAA